MRTLLNMLAGVFAFALLVSQGTPCEAASGTVTVTPYLEVPGSPAPKGLLVFVDDVFKVTTTSSGSFSLVLEEGTHNVAVLWPYIAGGSGSVKVTPGSTVGLELPMTSDGLASVVKYRFELTKILPLNSPKALSAKFLTTTGKVIKPRAIASAVVTTESGEQIDVKSGLSIKSSGVIGIKAGVDLTVLVDAGERFSLSLVVETSQGYLLEGEDQFFLGKYLLSGRLTAPPSNPSLRVSKIPITVKFLGTPYQLKATSDKYGRFKFKALPLANIEVSASAISGENTYSLQSDLMMDANIDARFVLRGAQDIVSGVEPIQVLSSSSAGYHREGSIGSERHNRAEISATNKLLPRMPQAGVGEVTVSSGPEGVRLSQVSSTSIPKGTKSVALAFVVSSDEYPEYVLQNSIYNDTWELKLLTVNGQVLKTISKNVNSQRYSYPYWQPDGSTGLLTEVVDVSAYTLNAPTTLILEVAATNVGDDLLPTTVTAYLSEVLFSFRLSNITNSTDGPGDIISIPKLSERNVHEKTAVFVITSPEDATVSNITNVKVEMLTSASSTNGYVIFNGLPDALGDKSFSVPITFTGSATSSPLSSVPPPTDFVQYKVEGTANLEGVAAEATAVTNSFTPLWRMPTGFARYSIQEGDFDDWSQRSTYTWLDNNRIKITRINDVSGEHGRNLSHATHKRGTDIDIFHYSTLNSISGMNNYLAAQELAAVAAGGGSEAATALATIRSFVQAQRTGLNILAGDSDVAGLFAGCGSPTGLLPSRWLESLMKSGKFTAKNKAVVEIDKGAELSPKIIFNLQHNDHNHITLTK